MKLLDDLKTLSEYSKKFVTHPVYGTAEVMVKLGMKILMNASNDARIPKTHFKEIRKSVAQLLYVCVINEESDFETNTLLVTNLNRISNEF